MKCKYCGTEARKDGWPFEKQGQLNLHEYHCKMRKEYFVNHEYREKPSECNHEFRLLSVGSPIEYKAYQNGYMEVCVKCQELR